MALRLYCTIIYHFARGACAKLREIESWLAPARKRPQECLVPEGIRYPWSPAIMVQASVIHHRDT